MNLMDLKTLAKQAIQDKLSPGFALAAGKNDQILFEQYFGQHTYDPNSRVVDSESIYDLASLTKIISTTYLLMLAHEENKIDATQYADLLTHTSGLPDRICFFEDPKLEQLNSQELRKIIFDQIHASHPGLDPGSKSLRVAPATRQSIKTDRFASLAMTGSQHNISLQRTGTRTYPHERIYSDLNFILLGYLLEETYGENLDQLFKEKIEHGFRIESGMTDLVIPAEAGIQRQNILQYNPASDQKNLCVPTEFCKWRDREIIAEVHDENAALMSGVAGHAGLFGNLQSVMHWVMQTLSSYQEKNNSISRRTWDTFVNFEEPYFFGFDRPGGENSLAGKYFSKNSIGHLAFTGCSLWMDLEDGKWIILLSNRIYPNRPRHSDKQKFNQFRRDIHNCLCEEIFHAS